MSGRCSCVVLVHVRSKRRCLLFIGSGSEMGMREMIFFFDGTANPEILHFLFGGNGKSGIGTRVQ